LRAVHRRAYRYDQTGPAEWIASSGGSYFAYTARISRVRDGHRLALTSAAKAFTRDIECGPCEAMPPAGNGSVRSELTHYPTGSTGQVRCCLRDRRRATSTSSAGDPNDHLVEVPSVEEGWLRSLPNIGVALAGLASSRSWFWSPKGDLRQAI